MMKYGSSFVSKAIDRSIEQRNGVLVMR
jgi:hypothetical protein